MVSYSWISVIALLGYLFLFLAFASAKKTKVIYSFLMLLMILIFWSGGSFLMRIQFWPSVNFWHYVSILGLMMLPYGFYRFYLDFLEEKRRRGRVFWLIVFLVIYVINLFTEWFIPTPEIALDADGHIKFLYTYGWQIYIMFIATAILLVDIIRLFFRYCKGDILMFRQLSPILIGILIVAAGNAASTLKVFQGIPVDIVSAFVFACCLFYALYKKRMFKLTVLVSPGNCYVVAILISVCVFQELVGPISDWLVEKLRLNQSLTLLLIALLMAACIYLMVLVMKKFLDNLFVKEEQVQAETIKQFSYTVSKTLNKIEILSSLVEVIQKMIDADKIYVFIQDTAGNYILEETASPLEKKGLVMKAEHPLVLYMQKHDGCLLMQDFMRTNDYHSMWEEEKQQLKAWGVECIAPMKDSSDLVGIVMLSEKEKGRAYSYDDFSLLMSVNSVCTMAVKNSKMYEQAYDEARKDELTGLFNRKRFYEVINEQFKKNKDLSLALIMVNVDDFKLYNQLYGAKEGDIALQKIASIIQATTADRGIAFRMVGKEFAILLPSYDIYSAKILAESISGQVRKMNEDNSLYKLKALTLSCGVCASPYMASSPEELIANADLAVYSAKRSGKNAVVMYSEDVQLQKEESTKGRVSYYDTYASTIYALTAAIDTKDHYTFSHSQNVAYYASELARAHGMNEECVDIVKEAGLLHDIGKIGIREDILNKPGRLTAEEYEIMKGHVENSIGIIRHLPSLDYVIPAVLSHHERYDGYGYPRGIVGEDIPIMGRILCVVDSFDAMISRRSYKRAMPVEQALQVLEEQKGKQFDPKLAEQFIKLVKDKKINIRVAPPEDEAVLTVDK